MDRVGWTYKEGSDGRVIPYPTSGVGDIRLEILNEVWATDPNIASFIILEMMGYINGDSKNSSSSDYSIGYNDGYSQYNSDLQSLLLAKYGKATVSEAVTAGIEAGVNVGETSVTSNPTAYNLVTKDAYDQALLDANATAEQAIANAQVSAKAEGINEGKAIGKSEGQSSVTSNPTAYNLVTQVAYDQMMNDLMSAFDSNATHYTEGWFYHPGRGWMWTTFSAYPYFYDATDKDWIYFHSGNEKPKFYRYKTKTWLTIE